MRLLYFSPRICWPLRSGAHLRDFHLARQLAYRGSLTYLGLDSQMLVQDGDMQRERLAELYDSEIVSVRRAAGYPPVNLLRGLVRPTPVRILNFTSATAKTVLEQLFREYSFDAVQVENVRLIA